MRKAGFAALVVAVVAMMTGVSFAEEIVTCNTLFVSYLPGTGFDTPAEAIEATAEVTDVEVPADLEVGTTELAGADEVSVIYAEDAPGYVPSYVTECVTETVLTVGGAAEAHGTSSFVNPFPSDSSADVWTGGACPDITYKFTAEVSQFSRDAMKRGFNAWEGQTSACFNIVQGGSLPDTGENFNCPGANDVHYEEIGLNGAAGAANVCSVGANSNIGSFNLALDNDPNWYRGADPNLIGANEYDMQMVATHEFGHALGIDHLDLGGGCPAGGGAATMCNANGPGLGETFSRSLEDHDRHTINPLY